MFSLNIIVFDFDKYIGKRDCLSRNFKKCVKFYLSKIDNDQVL